MRPPITKHSGLWLQAFIIIALFLLPFSYVEPGQHITLRFYLLRASHPMALGIVYYINYLWLVPEYAKGNKRTYWILNILLIGVLSVGVNDCIHLVWRMDQNSNIIQEKTWTPRPTYILREMFMLSVAAGISIAVYMSRRWALTEQKLKETEIARVQAELKSLRWQINPHFLLNTMNNIYALTEIDKEKAQKTILELSKLLNYILYEDQKQSVSLSNEMTVIQNYINLMKLRIPLNVQITEDYQIPKEDIIYIAPLLFISLVENAFKHGISATNTSFINIHIEANPKKITCLIKNSNYPKSQKDRSGHGIGLDSVAKRLQFFYPNTHEWEKGVMKDKNNQYIYFSKLTLYDTQLYHHR